MNNQCEHYNSVPYTPGLTTNRCGPVVFREERCNEKSIKGSKYCELHHRQHEREDKRNSEAWNKAIKNSPSMQKIIEEYKSKKSHE